MLLNKQRALAVMEREGLDALVAVTPKNVYYLSDYQSDWLFDVMWVSCAILPRRQDVPATLIVHDVELTNLAECPSWMPELRVYYAKVCGVASPHYIVSEGVSLSEDDKRTVELIEETRARASEGILPAIEKAVRDSGLDAAVLGFDDVRLAHVIGPTLPKARLVDALAAFKNIRVVKSPDEQAIMREAAKRNERALSRAVAAIREGAMWRDIVRAYNVGVVEQDCMPFCIYVGAGERSTGLRMNWDYPVKHGDQICFDAMMTYRRYFADIQRTCVLGEPNPKLLTYWNALLTGMEEAYDRMRPGVTTAQLRERAIDTVRRNGIPTFRHAFIHSLGLDHLEVPQGYSELIGFPLEAGMIVNMDLEVCEVGFGGVIVEESVLITDKGAERLASLPRELIRINGQRADS